ncbi:MAG TPA: hypothetical protein VEA78_03215 [Acidimicrobiales bacterium]|nr:hypothetical protein [Acidimicrobiales bacterium]
MKRPSVVVGSSNPERLLRFFADIGWRVEGDAVRTPGSRWFGVRHEPAPPRLELALSMPDPLHVDEVLEVVDHVGGILMEPPQETAYGSWGGTFNDPDGNVWELGAPETVTAHDARLGGFRPPGDGPIVALAVARRASR